MTMRPGVAAECHGIKVPQSPMITPERAARIDAARYEGQEIAGALSVIVPGDRVLEMGAGIGLVGAIAAHNCQPEKVLSFEANPDLIPHIEALYALNGLTERIEVRNQVLLSAPDAPDAVTFHVRNSYLGSSLIDTDARQTTPVEVPTASYNAVHAAFRPTVLLMDIEGGELDLLRHATLEGIRAIVIEFHPAAYGKKGMRACKQILEDAGFAKIPEQSTRQVWTCRIVQPESAPTPGGGWSTGLETLDKAIVVPPLPARQSFVQPAGLLHSDGRYCPGGALWRNGRALTTQPSFPRGDIVERAGTWLWGGVLWHHFGHFLTESTARLWALDSMAPDVEGVLFMPKRPRNGGEVTEFQRNFINLLGRDLKVESVEAPTRVERLIVPGQGFGLGEMITGTDVFRKSFAFTFARSVRPNGPEKVYISRSALPSGRGTLIGEDRLEAHLAAQGYTIYHPQQHPLTHQIATYKAARQILAAEGSALHLLAFVAHHDQRVGIIVRRPSGATDNLQKHLRSFASIEPDMLTYLRRSWKPQGAAKSRHWMGELDMPALQATLIASGFITQDGAGWESLDRKEVENRLGKKFEAVA